VKALPFLNPAPVFIEISLASLKALRENAGLEIALEREAGGRLTASCKERLTRELQDFLDRKNWQPRIRAYCAIGVAGVSLRRFSLPAVTDDRLARLLVLQMEREFPLPPDELAWGHRRLTPDGKAAPCEVLVAAVKKEAVEECAAVLAACGLRPVFTLAAPARNALCPQPRGSHALLDLAGGRPEWAVFDQGNVVAARTLSAATSAALQDALAQLPAANGNAKTLFLTGAGDEQLAQVATRLGPEVNCVPLRIEPGPGRSAATLGLKRIVEQEGGALPLVFQTRPKRPGVRFNLSSPAARRWLARAAVLLAALLLLPYAEALLVKPLLARKLAALKAGKSRLETIDRELDFLQFLKQSQPPYLDTLFVCAQSAPPGVRVESLTLNRRGEIALRGAMQNGQQVTDFRTKLMASGLFASIAVEEQSPTPDRQKVNLRMTAQWKPAADRAGLAIGPTLEEIERAKTNPAPVLAGGFPGGLMPPPMLMPGGPPGPRR
jgi:hypothetical protein